MSSGGHQTPKGQGGCWCDRRSQPTCNFNCARSKRLQDLENAAREVVHADAEYDRTLDVGFTQSSTIQAFNAVWAAIERLRAVLDA